MANDPQFIYELPYEQGRSFRVSQGYGGTYSHTGDSHYSIDFDMTEGTTICASRSGVVYRVVDHFREGGTHLSFKPKANTIHILHPDDTVAAYVHLSFRGTCVRPGDPVRAGQVIGFSGNTGWSGSPHLHFHVSDAVARLRIPTTFMTMERGATIVKESSCYTRPKSASGQPSAAHSRSNSPSVNRNHDPFTFSSELLAQVQELKVDLAAEGYEEFSDYTSIDVMHDVYGFEVCGVQDQDSALEVTRFLLRRFPGWNGGWLHPPDEASTQQWVASVQRDYDVAEEYWDTD